MRLLNKFILHFSIFPTNWLAAFFVAALGSRLESMRNSQINGNPDSLLGHHIYPQLP